MKNTPRVGANRSVRGCAGDELCVDDRNHKRSLSCESASDTVRAWPAPPVPNIERKHCPDGAWGAQSKASLERLKRNLEHTPQRGSLLHDLGLSLFSAGNACRLSARKCSIIVGCLRMQAVFRRTGPQPRRCTRWTSRYYSFEFLTRPRKSRLLTRSRHPARRELEHGLVIFFVLLSRYLLRSRHGTLLFGQGATNTRFSA